MGRLQSVKISCGLARVSSVNNFLEAYSEGIEVAALGRFHDSLFFIFSLQILVSEKVNYKSLIRPTTFHVFTDGPNLLLPLVRVGVLITKVY